MEMKSFIIERPELHLPPTIPLFRRSSHRSTLDPGSRLSPLLPDPNSPTSQTLFQICQNLGFFYLDLRKTNLGEKLLQESDEIFGVAENLYELGPEELQKYDFGGKGIVFGYKGFGKNFMVGEEVEGKVERDRNEFYNVPKDDLLKNSQQEPLPQPSLINKKALLLTSYTENAHSLIQIILAHLNSHLKLPPQTLADIHDISRISGDHIRLIKAPPQPQNDLKATLGKHTDFGSVTLLFNRVGGLQVQLPGKSPTRWHYVRPLPGHCIINLGDAMVKFTNGLLRSNIHRVVSPPGGQASCTRYSLVYFVRPADEVLLKRLTCSDGMIPELQEGVVEEDVDSKTWIRQKSLGKREGVWKGKAAYVEVDRSTERMVEPKLVVV